MSMLHVERKRRILALVEELEVDVLLFYGNGWRKDFFKCVIDLQYFGTYGAGSATVL